MQTKIACFISLLDCFRRKNASKCSTAQQRTLPTDRQERFYWRTPIPHGTHKHMHAHDQLPQPVRVYSVQHSTCIHMYSTCSVLYMYIVHCTVHVLYSRVVQLNDLAFRYKIVHSYTQTSAVRREYEYSLQTEAGYRAKSSKKEQEGPSTSFDNRCFYQWT